MKTEIQFIYQNRRLRTIVNSRSPSSAAAILFLQHPHLRNRCTIINCVGLISARIFGGHIDSRQHSNLLHT